MYVATDVQQVRACVLNEIGSHVIPAIIVFPDASEADAECFYVDC